MWFSFILHKVRWSQFITSNIFNNTLKCEFLSLTNPVFPIDLAQAMKFFQYIFISSLVSLESAIITSAWVKNLLPILTNTENWILGVVFATILSLLEDEVGHCWVCWSTSLSPPAPELHRKHAIAEGCADVSVPSLSCLSLFTSWRRIFSFIHWGKQSFFLKKVLKKSEMRVWDLVAFALLMNAKPTHVYGQNYNTVDY